MAYNNWGFRGQSNSGFNRSGGAPYSQGYQNQNYQQQYKKRSGCTTGMTKDGKKRWVSGWKVSKRFGFVKIIASPNVKKHKTGKSKSGHSWQLFTVKIQPEVGAAFLTSGFFYPDLCKLRIPDLGWVANPKAPNGGYLGKSQRPKQR